MSFTKATNIESSYDLLHKIEAIEKEVRGLKVRLLKKRTPSDKKIISLKGILKGVYISDQDITSSKRSLSSRVKP